MFQNLCCSRITESLEPEVNLPEVNLPWISSIIFVYFQFASGSRLFVTKGVEEIIPVPTKESLTSLYKDGRSPMLFFFYKNYTQLEKRPYIPCISFPFFVCL